MGPKLFLGLCRVTGAARAMDRVLGETGGKGSEKMWVPARLSVICNRPQAIP